MNKPILTITINGTQLTDAAAATLRAALQHLEWSIRDEGLDDGEFGYIGKALAAGHLARVTELQQLLMTSELPRREMVGDDVASRWHDPLGLPMPGGRKHTVRTSGCRPNPHHWRRPETLRIGVIGSPARASSTPSLIALRRFVAF
jgi:hypothetical protein